MFSFLIAVLPICWLIIALTVIKMPGWKACLMTAVLTAVLAIAFFGMKPLEALTASLEGSLNALWPISMVIIAALFTYNLTLETGAMERIKSMLSGVSSDKRIVALIIGWGFGNFMEGMAGFGTAVAIPAGIMVAMGYNPLTTVIACLVVNSTPTAFGSVGVPTSTLSGIIGVEPMLLSARIAIIQLIPTMLSPFLMVIIMGKGLKALKGIVPFTLAASLSFVLPQLLAAFFIGPELPDIIGAIICMIVLILMALKMNGKEVPEEYRTSAANPSGGNEKTGTITVKEAAIAWSPFILIFLILLFTSSIIPPVHDILAAVATKVSVYSGENPGTLSFAWIDCPGVKIMLAGILGGLIQGAPLKTIFNVLFRTLKANIKTIVTICSVLSVAKIMGYSGMISAIAALLVAAAGSLYPLIAPFIGMIGGFVTGSGTSTSVLFGGLQAETAGRIGVAVEWLAAANMLGAGVGKMISPQGIAIGAAASGLSGKESTILTKTIGYALFYILIGGILCYLLLPVFG